MAAASRVELEQGGRGGRRGRRATVSSAQGGWQWTRRASSRRRTVLPHADGPIRARARAGRVGRRGGLRHEPGRARLREVGGRRGRGGRGRGGPHLLPAVECRHFSAVPVETSGRGGRTRTSGGARHGAAGAVPRQNLRLASVVASRARPLRLGERNRTKPSLARSPPRRLRPSLSLHPLTATRSRCVSLGPPLAWPHTDSSPTRSLTHVRRARLASPPSLLLPRHPPSLTSLSLSLSSLSLRRSLLFTFTLALTHRPTTTTRTTSNHAFHRQRHLQGALPPSLLVSLALHCAETDSVSPHRSSLPSSSRPSVSSSSAAALPTSGVRPRRLYLLALRVRRLTRLAPRAVNVLLTVLGYIPGCVPLSRPSLARPAGTDLPPSATSLLRSNLLPPPLSLRPAASSTRSTSSSSTERRPRPTRCRGGATRSGEVLEQCVRLSPSLCASRDPVLTFHLIPCRSRACTAQAPLLLPLVAPLVFLFASPSFLSLRLSS